MLPISKINHRISLSSLCLMVLSPLFVNSYLLDPHSRAKIKLESQQVELAQLTYANLLSVATVGTPLFLSPTIKRGDIAEARRLAAVLPIPPLLPGIESFSGFITVNENLGSNLFFWMFKSLEGDWTSKPLIIWIQGGPGLTAMFGLVDEIGPFTVNQKVYPFRRKYTWCQKYNLLFIDSPVGTGFSFTAHDAGYPTSELGVAIDLYAFLVQFYAMFPELKSNPMYLIGESYAGKMIPAFAHYIHLRNKENEGKGFVVPLTAVAVGNGFSDPISMLDYSNYLYHLGYLDRAGRDLIRTYEDQIRAAIKANKWVEARNIFYDVMFGAIYNITQLIDPYNYIHEGVASNPPTYEFFMRPDVRAAIHVGNLKFNFMSDKVWDSMAAAFMQSAKPWIEDILNWGEFSYVSFSGMLDIICAYTLSENMFYDLNWKHAAAYATAKRCPYYMNGWLAGYVKTVGVFTEVSLRTVGHMVAYEEPEIGFTFLDTLMTNRTLGFRCD